MAVKWEYVAVTFPNDLEGTIKIMNQMGNEGWEHYSTLHIQMVAPTVRTFGLFKKQTRAITTMQGSPDQKHGKRRR